MEPIGSKHLKNVYSQNGEDGIIAEIFNRIGTQSKRCWECGAADGKWLSNTRSLIDAGWSATLIEADPVKAKELYAIKGTHILAYNETLTPDNADEILGQIGTDYDLGVLDIDGQEYYVWLGMQKILPRVMVVEFDPKVPKSYVPERGGTGQAGEQAIVSVGISKGYLPVVAVGPNLIFVLRDEFPKLGISHPDTEPPADKLNIGGGKHVVEGYHNVDRLNGEEAYPLQYKDECVSEVRASHVLEHFSHRDTLGVITEWVRVLKPGGVLKIAVPNFAWVCSMYMDGKPDPLLGLYVMGGHTDDNDKHGALFDDATLRKLMTDAGLVDIQPWTSDIQDCATLPVSLNLMGTKPVEKQQVTQGPKMRAILSRPRFGLNDFWDCATQALRRFDIPLASFRGVFWGQCMQRAMEEAMADGVDWLLCMDFDSMFTDKHIERLLSVFASRPDIDALAPLECRRGSPLPLATMGGKTQVATDGSPLLVTSAHFGLTLIRMSALKDIPKPWFVGRPDDNGMWGDERLDDDVWFWHQWRLAGKTIYMDPQCRIGHMEEMVAEFDEDMQPRHVYPVDWRKANRMAKPAREDAKEIAQ